jgi:hypothetical protein
VAKSVEDLIELFGGAQREIEKENFPTAQDTAAAVACQPFLADFIAQPPRQIEAVPQNLYRVHPCFSKLPTSVFGENCG